MAYGRTVGDTFVVDGGTAFEPLLLSEFPRSEDMTIGSHEPLRRMFAYLFGTTQGMDVRATPAVATDLGADGTPVWLRMTPRKLAQAFQADDALADDETANPYIAIEFIAADTATIIEERSEDDWVITRRARKWYDIYLMSLRKFERFVAGQRKWEAARGIPE